MPTDSRDALTDIGRTLAKIYAALTWIALFLAVIAAILLYAQ